MSEGSYSMIFKNLFPWQRKHTLLFADYAWSNRPVVLETEVDMSSILQHRQMSANKISYISYFIKAFSDVLEKFPDANSMIIGTFLPNIIQLKNINAKFTLDKTLEGRRIVTSAVILNSNHISLEQIQERVNYFKSHDFKSCSEFKPIRILQKIPLPFGRLLFNYTMKNANLKSKVQGSFTITSLGGRDVSRFIPLSGSTISLGLSDIIDKPIVKEGQIKIKPITNIVLVFDHRVLDGAISAEILSELKKYLENNFFRI